MNERISGNLQTTEKVKVNIEIIIPILSQFILIPLFEDKNKVEGIRRLEEALNLEYRRPRWRSFKSCNIPEMSLGLRSRPLGILYFHVTYM